MVAVVVVERLGLTVSLENPGSLACLEGQEAMEGMEEWQVAVVQVCGALQVQRVCMGPDEATGAV